MVLFSGFKRHKKSYNNKSKPSGIRPIKSATALLSSKDNQLLLQSIKLLVKPARRFDEYYLPVIEKFAEFVQNISENEQGFFGQQTDFLSHGLERVSRVLSLCITYFFPKQANFSTISKHNALWIYATFTAALFLDIGKIAVKYTIMLYHEKTYPFKKWDPYTSSMLGQGTYYKFDSIKQNFNELRQFITPLLARQILDSVESSAEKGFNWIASDPEVLELWFALLMGEEDRIPMTSFMAMIPQAEIRTIENYRKKNNIVPQDSAGEAFLQWIRKEISEGRIEINTVDAKVQIKEKEIILSSILFQKFANANTLYKHAEIVQKQFIDIARRYQIAVSELDLRTDMNVNDLYKKNIDISDTTGTHENDKISRRFLVGGIGLLALISSLPLHQVMQSESTEKIIIKPPLHPNLTT